MFNILKQMERVLWEQIRVETGLCSGGPALVINQFGDFTNFREYLQWVVSTLTTGWTAAAIYLV